MSKILSIFLLISTSITGVFWIYYNIKKIKNCLTRKKNLDKDIENSKKRRCFFKSLSSFFPIFLIVFIIRSFVYEPFQIPSGSMMPTLLVGDFILVEKFSYGLKNPITNKTIIHTNQPTRGDVVVFKHPHDNTDYIKRIVGIPGDKIQYDINNKHIKICKNYLIKNNCKEQVIIEYSNSHPSDFVQKIPVFEKNNALKKETKNVLHFDVIEENINNIKHNILLSKDIKNSTKYYFQQKNMPKLIWIVPEKQYFVMGDNRDNSLDSRYWGFVPEHNLLGKATKIWMSFKKNENEWPTGIRINRIGSIH